MQKLKPVEQQFNKNNRPYNTKAIFSHPFCPEFWRCAAGEFKNWRMLVFAAVIIAMRIAVKAVKIVIIPGALNFGFDYDEATGKLTLWFHSAPRGRKLDAIRAAAGGRLPVAFTMQTDCEVVAGRTTCNWGEVFKSIVGNGTASLVEDLDECRHGLQTLMAQQAHMPNVEFTDAQVRSVTVWKIESDYFTTKVRTKPAPAHMHQR